MKGEIVRSNEGVYDLILDSDQRCVIIDSKICLNSMLGRTEFYWEAGSLLSMSDENGDLSRMTPCGYLKIPQDTGRIEVVYHEVACNPQAMIMRQGPGRGRIRGKGMEELEHELDRKAWKAWDVADGHPGSCVLRVRTSNVTVLPADEPPTAAHPQGLIGLSIFVHVAILVFTELPGGVHWVEE